MIVEDYYIKIYQNIRNNFDNKITIDVFARNVFQLCDIVFEKGIDNTIASFKNSYDYKMVYILQNLISPNFEKFIQYSQLINTYHEKSLSLLQISTETLNKEFGFQNMGSHPNYDFLPYIFEFCRRKTEISKNDLKASLLWSMFSIKNIVDYAIKYKTDISIIVNDYSFEEIAEKLTEIELSICCILNSEFKSKYISSEYECNCVSFLNTLTPEYFGIKRNYEYILFDRTDYYNHEAETLEVIGVKQNVKITRERVRQIEKRCIDNLSSKPKLTNAIKDLFYEIENKNKYSYLTFEQFYKGCIEKGLSDIATKFVFSYIQKIEFSTIKLDENFQVVYDSCILDIRSLSTKIIDEMGITLKSTDYNLLENFEQKVVDSAFNQKNNGNYIKKGINKVIIVEEVIRKYFKNGYHAEQLKENDDFKKMNRILADEFGVDDYENKPRNICTFIERSSNLISIDRGVYIIRGNEYIPDDIVDDIYKFIVDNGPSVRYQAIFENFQAKLIKYGINNYYYLKSILDPCLRGDKYCKTYRDYISLSGTNATFRESLINYINSYDGLFTISDLIKKFPGTNRYVFDNAIASCQDIIYLENGSYIRIQSCGLTDEIIHELKKEIDDLMNKQNDGFISSRKLFARLKIQKPELLEKIPIIDSQFRLFSLISNIFKDKYHFHRPLIGVDMNMQINKYSAICDYLYTLDTFTNRDVKDFTTLKNIGQVYSYLNLMIYMSEEYIQIDIETMLKKTKTNIDKTFLDKLCKSLLFYIKSFGEIDTRTFKGYTVLPDIKGEWNKYLLVGIVRTYLSNFFDITYTDNMYTLTDFIIRGI